MSANQLLLMSILRKKILNKKAKIGIIGLGYVGIPYMVEFAKAGYKVYGFDISQSRVNEINSGISPIDDIDGKQLQLLLAKETILATTQFELISKCDCLLICVPTPCRDTKVPDLTSLTQVADIIENNAQGEQLYILQSTSYPGTTEEIILPALVNAQKKRRLKYYLAFSPERVDPGNKMYKLKNTPKVIGGLDEDSTTLSKLFFKQVVSQVVTTSSLKAAEMTKLLENSFRLINISFINEFAKLCETMGIDSGEVISAASTKPFGFMPFYPSIGIGGHCIPVDPYYLSWKAKEYNFVTKFIDLANKINEKRPYETAKQIHSKLKLESGKTPNKSKILALGVSFKPNIKDLRNSAALKVISLLNKFGFEVEYYDPFVAEIEIKEKNRIHKVYSNINHLQKIKQFDLVVVLTKHSGLDYSLIEKEASIYFEPFKRKSSGQEVNNSSDKLLAEEIRVRVEKFALAT